MCDAFARIEDKEGINQMTMIAWSDDLVTGNNFIDEGEPISSNYMHPFVSKWIRDHILTFDLKLARALRDSL